MLLITTAFSFALPWVITASPAVSVVARAPDATASDPAQCEPPKVSLNSPPSPGPICVSPHANYSSSAGVTGCKINIDRVAYFPWKPSCERYCLKVHLKGRELNLLHIDHSGGAFDVSYDAWNYLNTGHSADDDPRYSGGTWATSWEWVPNAECAEFIHTDDKKLPLIGINGVDYWLTCPEPREQAPIRFFNYNDMSCKHGTDDECFMPPLSVGNSPVCKNSQLGANIAQSGPGIKEKIMYQNSPPP